MSVVTLGFSGGVDSALSAMLLKQQGYEVHGVFLDNGTGEEDAVNTAKFIGIPLTVIDVKDELENKVCSEFEKAYLRGETPNPCIICNPSLKFKRLLECGGDYIATGHYARSKDGAIFKGHPNNDQSYMLCRLTKEQAAKVIFPLGEYPKTETRRMAAEFGIPVANKPDSMEICFIPDKDYIGWLGRRTVLPGEGNIILNGGIIGKHGGIVKYTVGQRYPGLIDQKKVYISKINSKDNTIELSFWDDLFKTEVNARDFNFLCDMPDEFRASVRVRHTKWENPDCTVYKNGSSVKIICDEPVRAPAAGQSAVLYQGDRLIGGGFIVQEGFNT